MQLVERRFYNNGSTKGVRGVYAKPTTNAAATADFLAAYMRLHTGGLVHVRRVTVTLSAGLSVLTDSSHCTTACFKSATSSAYALQGLAEQCITSPHDELVNQ